MQTFNILPQKVFYIKLEFQQEEICKKIVFINVQTYIIQRC